MEVIVLILLSAVILINCVNQIEMLRLVVKFNKENPSVRKLHVKSNKKGSPEDYIDKTTMTMLDNINNYDGTSNNQKDVFS